MSSTDNGFPHVLVPAMLRDRKATLQQILCSTAEVERLLTET